MFRIIFLLSLIWPKLSLDRLVRRYMKFFLLTTVIVGDMVLRISYYLFVNRYHYLTRRDSNLIIISWLPKWKSYPRSGHIVYLYMLNNLFRKKSSTHFWLQYIISELLLLFRVFNKLKAIHDFIKSNGRVWNLNFEFNCYQLTGIFILILELLAHNRS